MRVYKSKKELSRDVNIHSSTISHLTRLCFLSPTINAGIQLLLSDQF